MRRFPNTIVVSHELNHSKSNENLTEKEEKGIDDPNEDWWHLEEDTEEEDDEASTLPPGFTKKKDARDYFNVTNQPLLDQQAG